MGGFVPTASLINNPDMLYLAMGIIGATVMPHNLYLHSGIIQTRVAGLTTAERQEDVRFATLDSTLALCFALLVNAAILILAAAAFHGSGHHDVTELSDAHGLLSPLLGSTAAPTLFAIALIGCGLNSTITATLSGQIVMEGFLSIRIAPWLRRLATRLLAIVPAVIVGLLAGDHGTAQLLIVSQVILGIQLPFAVVPLLMFVSSKRKMGSLQAPKWQIIAGIAAALTIIALNIRLSYDVIMNFS
jgi:manganese transport protein